MKFFALLPLATLFLGAVASPTSPVALEKRETAHPLSTLQQFAVDSKQYTDTIHTAAAPLSPFSDPASLSAATTVIAAALQGLEELVTNVTAVLSGNGKIARTVVLRSGNPADSSAASEIAEFLTDLTSLSWNLQDLFGFAGPIGEALGPLVGAVTQLWAVVLSL